MGGEGSSLVPHETRFFLKQAGLGPLWGPGCSQPLIPPSPPSSTSVWWPEPPPSLSSPGVHTEGTVGTGISEELSILLPHVRPLGGMSPFPVGILENSRSRGRAAAPTWAGSAQAPACQATRAWWGVGRSQVAALRARGWGLEEHLCGLTRGSHLSLVPPLG